MKQEERPRAVGYESHLQGDSLMFDTPAPVPGCSVCAEFAAQWNSAMRRRLDGGAPNPEYDPTRATDVIVLMRRHKEAVHAEVKPKEAV